MQRKILQVIYSIAIFFLALTGFGQMPIYKRYYIADIPYLEWLSKFYITNAVHYIAAIVLITLAFYIIFDIIINKKTIEITPSGYAKIVMLSGLMVTGILILIKNFTGTPFSPNFIIVIDITHIIFCMALLIYSLHTLLTKQKGIMHNF
ncbi:MAG: hypothetical protein KAJ62_10275 [Desulfobacteraceae bacterium]|nr:hypothetical protein [Desulfobacteraceae bacterium]